MDIGRCRACGRPYTSGEVAGLGVLRARPASEGGPRIEMECPGCKTVLVFVPHGNGRYAPPGVPPPPPPSEEERRLPWQRTALPPDATPAAAPAGDAFPAGRSVPAAGTAPAPASAPASRPAARPAPDPDAPLTDPLEALTLLGVSVAANPDAIEAAFRERALQCHPDKVAHLDADIQALARRKFRRLQEARDLLLG